MSREEIFCPVDDFWKAHEREWNAHRIQVPGTRHRTGDMTSSEIMTICILFHQSSYRTFKAFYLEYVFVFLHSAFPTLVSYTRFVELMPQVLVPLTKYLQSLLGPCTGISFVDSTPLAVCHNRRIHAHKVFKELAARGKSSMGWFYGFKLHLVVNDRGELLSFVLTPGNVDDRTPVHKLAQRLFGKLFGDRGYIKQELLEELFLQGVHLITKVKKNMKSRLLRFSDKLLLRKRVIIESVNDQLKNISQIVHTRHRSPVNFLVNTVCGLIA